MPPDSGLANKQVSGVKGSKVHLTYALTANADGSEKLPPLIIGKAKKPCCFGNKHGWQLGFQYRNNAKAWMTTELYQEWIWKWDGDLRQKNHHILLLQDNFSGHIPPDDLTNICVVNFEPNLTSHIQPDDQGIIRCFKAHYRRHYIQFAINCYDSDVTPSDIYDINQLEAMWLADMAWKEVDPMTIFHCWKKAGILPSLDNTPAITHTISSTITSLLNNNSSVSESNPLAQAEQDVEHTLDDLVSRGVLQSSNCMSINALLNPVQEQEFMNEDTEKGVEQGIYEVVMHAVEARACSEMNGGDDDIDNDYSNAEPHPNHRDALKAVSTVQRYLEDVDEPFAWKLESLLTSSGHQTCLEDQKSKVQTDITDYFTQK